jgi:hypothetical protein
VLALGYKNTQGRKGNLLFFHYQGQEDKDLQEDKGCLFAVFLPEKSSLPVLK